MTRDLDTVLAYHERSKHHFHRYAAGPGGLDWATQPDPFRTFAGSPLTPLPLLPQGRPPVAFRDLDRPAAIPAQTLHLDSLAALLQLSFGLSAWKAYGGSRWALRCNPSSGNLHPTEAYVVARGCPGLTDGVHHYLSRDHALELRHAFGPDAPCLPPGCVLVGLSSIFWREAWKYGERAFRYCQHDVGHALAAVSYAAAVLGWQVRLLDTWSDTEIAALLGLDRAEDFPGAEPEHPDLLLLVGAPPLPAPVQPAPWLAAGGEWMGRANRLSPHHGHDWPVIEDIARASRKPATPPTAAPATDWPPPLASPCALPAADLIRRRRSAQAFDGVTGLAAEAFFRLLDATLPRGARPPWDAFPWTAHIHLFLFVHRVQGLAPGLYLLVRNPASEARLRRGLSPRFRWTRAEQTPEHLPLFLLETGDARQLAQALACHQDIAADGAFSLAMLAEFEDALHAGPWHYRTLFWEAGMVGQVLYLEAEAAGLSGTGIGCFFDDPVHELAGVTGRAIQDLYHFTVGRALHDPRLQTLPAYAHLSRPAARV